MLGRRGLGWRFKRGTGWQMNHVDCVEAQFRFLNGLIKWISDGSSWARLLVTTTLNPTMLAFVLIGLSLSKFFHIPYSLAGEGWGQRHLKEKTRAPRS